MMRYVRVFFQLLLRPVRPQQGKKLSFIVKVIRCVLAFLEGAIAAINRGARHPVAAYGGGVRGAWQLAKREWKRSTTLEDLPAPGNSDEDILMIGSDKQSDQREQFDQPTRYVPVSSGALGSRR